MESAAIVLGFLYKIYRFKKGGGSFKEYFQSKFLEFKNFICGLCASTPPPEEENIELVDLSV
jgi:hypothetical protein